MFRIQCILTLRYMSHKIHSRYMCQIHGDTCTLIEDTYLKPYLRPRVDARLGDSLGAMAAKGAMAAALGALGALDASAASCISVYLDVS